MRQPLPSESPEVGPAARLPANGTPSTAQSVDETTLELLAGWQREDATADPAGRQAAEEELAEFKKAVNDARASSGEPPVYP